MAKGFPEEKVILLRNCVKILEKPSYQFVVPLDFSAGNGSKIIIATVGNIRKNKNIHIFIDGLARILTDYDDLLGVIVGQSIPDERIYYDEIKHLIYSKNLKEKVLLLGFRDDAPALMHCFDVICLLSDNEGTPNTLLEAMAAGRPVIATNTSGIPDLVQDGVSGLLVSPGDVQGFENALRKMLQNPIEAENMGKKGLQIVQKSYSCKHSVDRLINIYEDLLRSH
jgi:glycosyltransferase involved in cell wall biosynthesis